MTLWEFMSDANCVFVPDSNGRSSLRFRFILGPLAMFNEKWLCSLRTNFPLEFYYWNRQNKSPWILNPTCFKSQREQRWNLLLKKKIHTWNIFVHLRQWLAIKLKWLFFFLSFFCVWEWGKQAVWSLDSCECIVIYNGLFLHVVRKHTI